MPKQADGAGPLPKTTVVSEARTTDPLHQWGYPSSLWRYILSILVAAIINGILFLVNNLIDSIV